MATGRRLPFRSKGNTVAGIAVVLWCIASSSALRTNYLIPKWMFHIPDDNMTGVPMSMIWLEQNLLQPIKRTIQNILPFDRDLDSSRALQKTQRRVSDSAGFFCNTTGTRSPVRPTSVHELRPGDVDVIGAIGDSLTAGTGSLLFMSSINIVDYRGISWAAGGQRTWKEFLTIPNILKVFNPKLVGYSYGNSITKQRSSQFNVAEPGAVSRDLPFMTRELVNRIKMDKRVDLNKDWKFISIMMSSNTFCLELCYENYKIYAQKHKEDLFKSLLYIKEHLPRTMVNLVLSINLEAVVRLTNMPPICIVNQIIECPCLFATQYKRYLPDYIDVMKQFQKVEKEIVEHEEMKNKDDFTVVLQTFAQNLSFPKNRFNSADMSYFASDCFHLSQKGYARATNAIWNNMMEPVGNKSTNWTQEFDRFLCPTDESPYIRTWKNSL